MDEGANIFAYDPAVEDYQVERDFKDIGIFEKSLKKFKKFKDPYEACENVDAVVICTDWDEFAALDFHRIYKGMKKPSWIFDGRLILDKDRIEGIGFEIFTIGK